MKNYYMLNSNILQIFNDHVGLIQTCVNALGDSSSCAFRADDGLILVYMFAGRDIAVAFINKPLTGSFDKYETSAEFDYETCMFSATIVDKSSNEVFETIYAHKSQVDFDTILGLLANYRIQHNL